MEQPPDLPEEATPLEIPAALLSPEALRGVVESFILREGTDYGEREHTHEEKVAQVLAALDRREARIVYDPATETVTLLAVAR
jgi:uncharacterized protein YheU (UPF0270 family)